MRSSRFLVTVCLVGSALVGPAAATAVASPGIQLTDGAAAADDHDGSAPARNRTRLVPADGVADDGFGNAVAVEGGTVVVGAPNADAQGKDSPGAAYVFEQTPSGPRQYRLTGRSPNREDRFGTSVAISGDTVIIGVQYDDNPFGQDSGSAYVFVRAAGGGWVQQAQLIAPDGVRYDGFGASVDIDGDTAVVGAAVVATDGSGANPTATYVFQRSASTWSFQTRIEVPNFSGTFIHSPRGLALQGDTLLIGASSADVTPGDDTGAVYVFERSGGQWLARPRVPNPDPQYRDRFGVAVSLEGDTMVVGATGNDGPAEDSGEVYVYLRSGAGWALQAQLQAPNPRADDRFGYQTAVDGDRLVVGRPGRATSAGEDAGQALVYSRTGVSWTLDEVLTAGAYGRPDGVFGIAVAADDGAIAVGASGDPGRAGTGSGAAYVYQG